MTEIKTKIGEGGRIVIPAEYRKELGLKAGDEVILVLERGEVKLLTPRQAVQHAQDLVRHYIPKGRSLSEELLRERSEEADRD